MTYDDDNFGLTVNEHELHDIIAGLKHLYTDNDSQRLFVDNVKIVPSEPDKFTPALVAKWEQNINDLLDTMGGLDADYHDDAEYTC